MCKNRQGSFWRDNYMALIAIVFSIISLVFSSYNIAKYKDLNNRVLSLRDNTLNRECMIYYGKGFCIENNNKFLINKESNKEINEITEFYKDLTDVVIDRVDLAVSAIGVILSALGILGIAVTFYNFNASEKAKKEMDTVVKNFDENIKNIERIQDDIKNFNILKHFIIGNSFLQGNKINYAIEEFNEISNSALSMTQLATIYAEKFMESVPKKDEYLNYAISVFDIEVEENKEDEKIMAELFYTKGCVYGIRGKFKNNQDDNEESIKAFKKAIELRKDDYKYYMGIALTYYHMNKIQEMKKSLSKAIWAYKSLEMPLDSPIDVLCIFTSQELEEMGKEKFNEYEKFLFETQVSSQEQFEERIIRKKKEEEDIDIEERIKSVESTIKDIKYIVKDIEEANKEE